MGDLDQNQAIWDNSWDWSERGDEWSAWWGGTPALWFGALLPRIHAFVPTGTILEIAPGYGRWTQYLKDLCDCLVIVDLAERCIEGCRQRFGDAENIEYHVNDGRSLEMVADGSIDFAFSFDSLVHVEADVLKAYIGQLAMKLKPDGVGFVHHSNVGSYRLLTAVGRRLPPPMLRQMVNKGAMIDLYAWRAESVTAKSFSALCGEVGLACVSQEKISWEFGSYLIDTMSVFTPRGSVWERPTIVVRNPHFQQEASRMARLYARTAFPKLGPDRG